MNTTSASLLHRLHQQAEQDAWGRFVHLYTPLLCYWARRLGVEEADAADLVQDVFAILVQKLPEFQYDPSRSFRAWLRTVLHNRWRDLLRRRPPNRALIELESLPASEGVGLDEEEYRQHLVSRALQLMQAEFSPRTWKACWEHVVVGRAAAEVAAELGITPGSVYVAKARVMCRLRQELEGLLD